MRINQMRWIGYAGILGIIAITILWDYSRVFQKRNTIEMQVSPVLGIDYVMVSNSEIIPTVLPQERVTVLEFFSYGCKGCEMLEKPIRTWLALQPSFVRFESIPLHDETPYMDQIIRLHYLVHQLKANMTATIFQWLNEGRNLNVIKQPLLNLGVSSEDYERAISQQAGLDAQVARGKNLQKAYQIEEPATFIIGDYYKTSLSMADGDLFRLFETINALIEKLRKANA